MDDMSPILRSSTFVSFILRSSIFNLFYLFSSIRILVIGVGKGSELCKPAEGSVKRYQSFCASINSCLEKEGDSTLLLSDKEINIKKIIKQNKKNKKNFWQLLDL